MPATAKVPLTPGVSIRLTPATSPTTHSLNCSACSPTCAAVSAAEHAVSVELHGPCRPSTYDSLPAATECDDPVAAYTLAPAGDIFSTSAKSFAAMPRNTPVRLPASDLRSSPPPCSAR
eukprot:1663287-Prymnesium_polylepis.1